MEKKIPTKEEFIEATYESLKQSYPDCKETIKENLEKFEKGEKPQNIIWMWMQEDVEKYLELKKEDGNFMEGGKKKCHGTIKKKKLKKKKKK